MKACEGVRLSFKVQRILSSSTHVAKPTAAPSLVRGLRLVQQEAPQALNLCIYSLLRSVRQQRRGFLKSLLQFFDDSSKIGFEELLYVADNLSAFPYQTLDEPLFVIHSVDLTVSVTGATLLQAFEDALLKKQNHTDVDEAETEQNIFERLPQNIQPLEDIIKTSLGCGLLLVLKQYLKEAYGINDSKIQEYSPSEPAKTYDKAVARRSCQAFNPKSVVVLTHASKKSADDAKRHLCKRYIDFKEKLMSIDIASSPEEVDTSANDTAGQQLNVTI